MHRSWWESLGTHQRLEPKSESRASLGVCQFKEDAYSNREQRTQAGRTTLRLSATLPGQPAGVKGPSRSSDCTSSLPSPFSTVAMSHPLGGQDLGFGCLPHQPCVTHLKVHWDMFTRKPCNSSIQMAKKIYKAKAVPSTFRCENTDRNGMISILPSFGQRGMSDERSSPHWSRRW